MPLKYFYINLYISKNNSIGVDKFNLNVINKDNCNVEDYNVVMPTYENGEIKIHDIIYTACLMEEENETILKGEIVEIVTLRGNKVVVKKID